MEQIIYFRNYEVILKYLRDYLGSERLRWNFFGQFFFWHWTEIIKTSPILNHKPYNHAPGVHTCFFFKAALFRSMRGFWSHSPLPSLHSSLPPPFLLSPATLSKSSKWAPVINTIIQDDQKKPSSKALPFWAEACRATQDGHIYPGQIITV